MVTVYLRFQGWLQLNGYSASQLHHRYPKPYIKLKLIELGIQIFHCFFKKVNSQVFRKVGTWRSRSSFKSSNSMRFLYFGSLFFFSRSGSQKLKKRVGVEMAFKERIFRIITFPDTFLLVIYFSSTWPNFTEIGQIIVELKVSPASEN